MKMINKKLLAVVISVLSLYVPVRAQVDSNIGHFWTDRSYFNPAYLVPAFHFSLDARKQQMFWGNHTLGGQPFTSAVNVTWFLHKPGIQLGAQVKYDRAGYTNLSKADASFAYGVGVDDRVNFGLSCGISYFYYDVSQVKVDDDNDEWAYNLDRTIHPNYNVGVEWIHKVQRRMENADEFTLGASALNLEDFNSHNYNRTTVNKFLLYSSYRLCTNMSMTDFLSGGSKFFDFYCGGLVMYYDKDKVTIDDGRTQADLHFSVILVDRDKDFNTSSYNNFLNRGNVDRMALGVSLRHNLTGAGWADIVPNLGLAVPGTSFYIGYCCDMVVRDDLGAPRTSHEIFIEYKYRNKHCLTPDNQAYRLLGGK